MLRVGSFRNTRHSSQSSGNTSPQISPSTSHGPTPLASPFESAANSPNISPTSSPMTLRRASHYKHKSKKHQAHRGTTEELIRKKKEINRMRSKSTPSLPGDFEKNDKRCLSTQSSFSEGSFSDEKDFHSSTETISSKNGHKKEKHKSRKKSFSAIFGASLSHLDIKSDFKKIIDHAPKLKRSNSHRSSRSKQKEHFKDQKTSFSDDENENYDGPLFHAITVFVPGYDFKTKQATPIMERKQSTPVFGRRGSKEKLPLFNRNSKERLSVPNLSVRRGSKEKIKKTDPKRHSDHFIQTDKFSNEILNKLKLEATKTREILNDDEFLSVTDRQNIIKDKYKQFENLGKTAQTKLEIPPSKLEGKVKKLSGAFESGKAFTKNSKNERIRKLGKSFSLDTNIVRDRATTFETGKIFKNRETRSRSDITPNKYSHTERNKRFSYGTESGYNSPNDGLEDYGINFDARQYIYKNIPSHVYENESIGLTNSVLNNILYEDALSSSWSHGQWKNENTNYQVIRMPSSTRIYSTDLCVTEL